MQIEFKKIFLFLVAAVISIPGFAQIRFHRGVNLTNWFQTDGARQIQFTRYTRNDFENIKSLGCDVIRLPVNLHSMTDGAPDYIIDPLFYQFLDSAVSWAEELQIYLIIDNHSFDPAVNTDPGIGSVLNKVWKQMAEHYKNRSAYVLYEILNEPHGINDDSWSQIQGTVIHTIRTIDKTHALIAGPANWNSYNDLKYLTVYDDDNIIYTFHFYDPFVFTHQGASWTDPPMSTLSGVPFPYDDSRMPSCPPDLTGTWINSSLNDYPTQGNAGYVKSLINIAVDFMNQHHVPVFCGEFGVLMNNSMNDDRVAWYQEVRKYFEEKNIPWTIWDYQNGFGLFNKGSAELFDYDINLPLVNALGLSEPPQYVYHSSPDTTGFKIYGDFIGHGLFESGAAGSGEIDFYSNDGPMEGKYCLHWTGGEQYTQIGFDMIPDRDLSHLVKEGFEFSFWVRGTTGISFDVRFVDSKTQDPADHPWRMDYTVDQSIVAMDNKWHFVRIPLRDFVEQGSWDNNTWYTPEGKFDWQAADRLELVAETGNLLGMQVWFDNINIDFPVVSGFPETENDLNNLSVYPNPFSDNVNFRFTLERPSRVEIKLLDVNGQVVSGRNQSFTESGEYNIPLITGEINKPLPCGIYFFTYSTSESHRAGKVIKVK